MILWELNINTVMGRANSKAMVVTVSPRATSVNFRTIFPNANRLSISLFDFTIICSPHNRISASYIHREHCPSGGSHGSILGLHASQPVELQQSVRDLNFHHSAHHHSFCPLVQTSNIISRQDFRLILEH